MISKIINNKIGHSYDVFVPVTYGCNLSKFLITQEDFKNFKQFLKLSATKF